MCPRRRRDLPGHLSAATFPMTVGAHVHNRSMRPRDILAANLRALMAARPDLDSLPKITARSGVSNGTLDRIRRAVVSTRVDELEKLGRAFGIEPWELLRPHGHAAPSPLALLLAAQLDRAVQDPGTHAAAYAAATAVIDALCARPGSPSAPAPAPEARPVPAPEREKPGV
jgi:transcriptional regulator with XRE-family HTH domain